MSHTLYILSWRTVFKPRPIPCWICGELRFFLVNIIRSNSIFIHCYSFIHSFILSVHRSSLRSSIKVYYTEATGAFLELYPFLARDSTLSIPNKLTLYKLCIRSILTYAAPVWSNTSSYNYHRLQISQSKCLRVIGNYPRRTPIPRLHATLNVTPIREFIYHLTANFFDRCPAHPNPLDRSI
jgi:hypothetical protein